MKSPRNVVKKSGGTFMILLANGKSLISVESQLLLNLEPKLKF